jgi:hypothetical protein
MVARKQRKGSRLETQYNLQNLNPSDLLSLAKSHLLKFPEPPKIAPPAGDQAFKT